jgi:hypothetical protein
MLALQDNTGIIHFHSEYSFDGRVPLKDILRAARRNSIDFLMLTDHACLTAREKGMEGWRDDVLLIVGQEITPRFNHYLAFGIHTPITVDDDEEIPPQVYIDEVNRQGGMGFIAHPDHEGTELFHVKHFPWTDWNVSDYTGIGIWDFMSDWQSSLVNYPVAAMSYLFPAFFLRGPRRITLERWDSLTRQHKVVGIGELDNHDTPWRILGLTLSVFPFTRAFRFVRTHVLTDEPLSGDGDRDASVILNALSRGRAYIAMEYFRNAKGFEFILSNGGNVATMGDTFPLKKVADLSVRVPFSVRIRIIKDGVLWWEGEADHAEASVVAKGVYRVEAYLKSWGTFRPWIFSNPIYVL